MPTLTWRDRRIELRTGETVLAALLRHGVHVPYYCQIGACQTCLLRVTAGTPPAHAAEGLANGLRQRGYFYSCIAVPADDLGVDSDDL